MDTGRVSLALDYIQLALCAISKDIMAFAVPDNRIFVVPAAADRYNNTCALQTP